MVRIGSGARTQVALRDRLTNSRGIYSETRVSGTERFVTLQSGRTQSSAWVNMATVEGYIAERPSRLDVRVRVCEDAPLRPDICSVSKNYKL